MLVLRRRANEVIVFDGGLSLTVLEIASHRAWLGFEAPSLGGVVALASLEVDADGALVAVRSPTSVEYEDGVTTIGLAESNLARAAHLALRLGVGDELVFKGMRVVLAGVEHERATLTIEVEGMAGPIAVSVHAITGAEVRLGIDAPDDVRVYRKELWLDLLGANQAAAAWSSGDLDGLLGTGEGEAPQA